MIVTYNLGVKPLLGGYRHFIRQPHNLTHRYGSNSWAMITGGSDGIGKGYAHQLARQGFNIYLIARKESKLQDLCNELEEQYGVKTSYMCKDFSKAYQEDFFNDLFEDTLKHDVSVLVNNVGMISMKALPDETSERVRDVITANTYPQAMLSQEYIRRMKKRSNKSAIISLSSFSGGKPISVCPIYSCTKGYNDYLSRALNHEFKQEIDISNICNLTL